MKVTFVICFTEYAMHFDIRFVFSRKVLLEVRVFYFQSTTNRITS